MAAEETLREGYLSVRGGFRVGLCGTAVMKDGENTALRDLSSAAVRIAREQRGIGEAVAAPAVPGRAVSEHPAVVAPRRRQDHAAAGSGAVPLLRRHRQAGFAGLPH